MTQFLEPLTDTLISGSWGLVGAPTRHEAIDETIALTDGNTSYIQGFSGLGVVDFGMTVPIECGGVRSGPFVITMRARRVGAVFNPDDEPKIAITLFGGSDPTPIATAVADFRVGVNVFTDYLLTLTERQALNLWPPNTLCPTPRIRLEQTFCLAANTTRVTTLEMAVPNPLIIPDPVHLVLGFGQLSSVMAGTAREAAGFKTSRSVGQLSVCGGRGMVNRCP